MGRRFRLNMGLFSKTPKLNAKIVVGGVEIEFHRDHEWWGFIYRGTKFSTFDLSLTLPTKAELDVILDTLESLKSEMKSRLTKGPEGTGGLQLDDGESYMVDAKL